MKIGVIAQRFAKPLDEALALAASTGVDGVQLYAVSPRENLLESSPAERRELVRRCADLGLEIFSVCGEVGGFGFREADANPRNIDKIRRSMDLALSLGCGIVTSHIGVIQPAPSPKRAAQQDSLRKIGTYAAACGAVLAIETGPERGAVLKEFLDELAQPGIAVNLDPGNMAMITGEDPCVTAEILAPYIRHTHLKDGCHYHDCEPEQVYAAFASGGIKQLFAEHGAAFMEKPIGSGSVDWPRYLSTLHRLRLDRFPAVIEREVSPRSVPEARSAVTFLTSFLAGKEVRQEKASTSLSFDSKRK